MLAFRYITCLLLATHSAVSSATLGQSFGTREGGADKTVRQFDASKRFIEAPLENLLDQASVLVKSQPKAASLKLESKPRQQSLDWSPPTSEAEQDPFHTSTEATSANPQCQPGLVTWHNNFEAACKASQISQKPVLLFQLLGNLDQRHT